MKVKGAYNEYNVPVFRIVGGALAVVALLWFLFTMSWYSVPVDKVGLHYSGGPIQGQHFVGVINPGTGKRFYGLLETVHQLPVTQRNYIISKNASEGDRGVADSISAPSKDGVPFDFELATYFKLNTSHSVLRKFYEQICIKYDCTDLGKDGGWDRMLNDSFRQQIENALQSESRRYSTDDLANNRDAIAAIQTDVGSALKDRINTVLGGPFFCGPTYTSATPNVCPDFQFVIKHIGAPQGIRDNYQGVKASQIAVDQKRFEVEQAKLQADAARELNAAINNNPNYVLLKAIESGKISFWVLPQGQALTLPTQPAQQPPGK